jgi:hypothetical protein
MILINSFLAAQNQSYIWNPPDERLFVESKWRYTYTLHVESNTIIHKADNDYKYYLYFRYDNTYQQFLHTAITRGIWSLKGRILKYSFQQNDEFEVVFLTKKVLVLEFKQKTGKGTYQYHYERIESKDAPFIKPPNELPEVIVEAENPARPNAEKKGWFSFFNKFRKQPEPKPAPVYINIELVGGGYFGGIDPVLKDFIHIKTDGRLIKEFQSENTGLLVTKKNIPREELELFADFIVKQKFFEFNRVYDCENEFCFKRMNIKPTPVPLRLAVTYGARKKIVSIAIWGKDDRGIQYIQYPPALDNIIDAIQRMASRLDDPIVRK